MSKTAIEFKNVRKKFENNSQEVLSGVNAKIKEGEFITILGSSGSGKTTLLKMVNKILEPSSGEILFFGKCIKDINTVEHKRKIGYVIQQIGLFPHMTIEDNIATVPKILKWKNKDIDARVDYLLELMSLDPKRFKTRYPRQLSGGQQQRVGLARAMAADPSIMLMDEPFGAIDSINRKKLQDDIIYIQKKLNKTILFVTHDIDEALKLGDRVLILNDGKVEQFDTPFNIIFKAKNEFVSKLLSNDILFQKLRVIKAIDVMIPSQKEYLKEENTIDKDQTLYEVLDIFMNKSLDYITVLDENKKSIGQITWNEIRVDQSMRI